MRIEVEKEQIGENHGIEMAVRGFQGDTGVIPTQVYVEYYEDKLKVYVWDGSDEDPVFVREIPQVKPKTTCPEHIHVADPNCANCRTEWKQQTGKPLKARSKATGRKAR